MAKYLIKEKIMFKSIKEFFFGKPIIKEEVPYKVEVVTPVVAEVPLATQQPVVVPTPVPEPEVPAVVKEEIEPVKPKKTRAKKPEVEKKVEVSPAKTKKATEKKETPAAIKAKQPRKTTKTT